MQTTIRKPAHKLRGDKYMNNDYFEADFKGFGYRELSDAAELLKEIGDNGISDKLNLSMPVKIGFNANSGNVFLLDEDYNCVMDNPETGKLENWVNCSNCGSEDFASALKVDIDEAGHCEKCVKVPDVVTKSNKIN